MDRTRPLAAALACLLAPAGLALPPTLEESPEHRWFAERCEEAGEALGVPGFAVAIVEDGEVVAAQGFGVRDAGPGAPPVDAETMFYIASCTKPYLAAGCCLLAQAGRLDLDEPVRTYLPELTLADAEAARTITVRDLLCHRPGLGCGPAVMLDAYTGQITDERFFYHLAAETPAGEVDYTNTHFTLAGRVIERITGRAWRDYLDEALFTPAGLDRTTGYASELYLDPNCAYPLERVDGELRRVGLIKDDSVMHAAGGLGTSALDAARWLALAMDRGTIDGEVVLDERFGEAMVTLQSRLSETEGSIRRTEGFGLGWQVGSYRGLTPLAAHGGGYMGTAAYLALLPEKRLGMVILANAAEGHALSDVLNVSLFDRALGVEDPPDLLPAYVERIERRAHRLAERRDQPGTPITTAHLSLPAPAYLGTYRNDHWGDLTLALEGGEMVARLGIMRLAVHAGDGGRDTGRLVTRSGDTNPVEFEADPRSGVVRAVTIEPRGGLRVRYERR